MDTRRIRRLRAPQAIEVVTGAGGLPVRLRLGNAWHAVALAREPWRIDQHWWRDDAIRRDYFRVLPENSPALTIYHDLVTGEWARQEYVGAKPGNVGIRTKALSGRTASGPRSTLET
jgi:hypothetical protein